MGTWLFSINAQNRRWHLAAIGMVLACLAVTFTDLIRSSSLPASTLPVVQLSCVLTSLAYSKWALAERGISWRHLVSLTLTTGCAGLAAVFSFLVSAMPIDWLAVGALAGIVFAVHGMVFGFRRYLGNSTEGHAPEPKTSEYPYLLRQCSDGETSGFAEDYAGRSIMITGAGGTIGSELVRQVLDLRPRRVILVDHSEHALYQIQKEVSAQGCVEAEIVSVLSSVCDAAAMKHALTEYRVDTVFHAAAYKHVPLVEQNARSGLINNVLGTQVLHAACAEAGVARFILVSSDKAVRPSSVMGASKWIAEQLVRDASSRSTMLSAVVRFGNVLGSSGSVLPLFIEQARAGGPLTVTHPQVERFFMTVGEAVGLVLHAGTLAQNGCVYTLDMGAPVRVLDLARQVIEREGQGTSLDVEFTGLRAGEKLRENLTIGRWRPCPENPKLRHCYEEPLVSELEVRRLLARTRAHVEAVGPVSLESLLASDGFDAEQCLSVSMETAFQQTAMV